MITHVLAEDTEQIVLDYIKRIKEDFDGEVDVDELISKCIRSRIAQKNILKDVALLCTELNKTWKRDGRPCFYCNKTVKISHWTVDHKVPMSRGGSPIKKSNLVKCCEACNVEKGNLTADEYIYLKSANLFSKFPKQ